MDVILIHEGKLKVDKKEVKLVRMYFIIMSSLTHIHEAKLIATIFVVLK